MWQCFNFTTEEMNQIQQKLFFHASLRTTARQLAQKVSPTGKYNALHIRFADGEANRVRENWLKPSTTFLYRMKMAKFLEISPYLYIATVPSKIDSPYFVRFCHSLAFVLVLTYILTPPIRLSYSYGRKRLKKCTTCRFRTVFLATWPCSPRFPRQCNPLFLAFLNSLFVFVRRNFWEQASLPLYVTLFIGIIFAASQ